jgi:regulatory protein
MIITRVAASKKRGMVDLYIDGQLAATLTELSVLSASFYKGQEIGQKELDEAVFSSDCQSAFSKSVNYLARGLKSQKQMSDYLKLKSYGAAVVKKTLEKLAHYGYVNDALFAASYSQYHSSHKGPMRIRQELLAKGVKKEVIESNVLYDEETSFTACLQSAQKYMRSKDTNPKNILSLKRHLLYKGYTYEQINKTVAKIYNNEEE